MVNIAEYLSSVLILIGIWQSGKTYKGWIMYGIASVVWTVVNFYYGLIGYGIVGIITTYLAVKNYISGKEKE